MKAIILAAGYATRMYPLTENFPKPLLEVGGVSVIDRILEQLKERGDVDSVYVVTNNKFYSKFLEWGGGKSVTVLNDGTLSNDDRLGAIGDLNFVLETEKIDDDIIVLAGDVILDKAVDELLTTFKKDELPLISVKDMFDKEKLAGKYGVLELDSENTIVGFEEKPENPKTSLKNNPFFIVPKKHLSLVKEFVSSGSNTDAPGNFVAWFCKKTKMKAVMTEGAYWDIGSIETYKEADKQFSEAGK